MRRNRDKITPKTASTEGDIHEILSKDQLAAIATVMLAYNEVESEIDELFYLQSDIYDHVKLEISSRLLVDSKLEIIKKTLESAQGIEDEDRVEITFILGENCFIRLKSIRNSIVHARVVNASVGIGLNVEKKAKIKEVLLNLPALDALYRHLLNLRNELRAAHELIYSESIISLMKANKAPGPDIERFEATKSEWTVPFRNLRDARLSLPPLPEFPSESEIREAEARWFQERQAAQTGWMQPFSQPVQRAFFHPHAGLTVTEPILPPQSPPQGKK